MTLISPAHAVTSRNRRRCTRCTFPIPAGTRHWTIAGYRICDACLWPGEAPQPEPDPEAKP